jgi:hypothetical protein
LADIPRSSVSRPYLAAFAFAGGYRMATTDAAFRQFRGLDLELLGG